MADKHWHKNLCTHTHIKCNRSKISLAANATHKPHTNQSWATYCCVRVMVAVVLLYNDARCCHRNVVLLSATKFLNNYNNQSLEKIQNEFDEWRSAAAASRPHPLICVRLCQWQVTNFYLYRYVSARSVSASVRVRARSAIKNFYCSRLSRSTRAHARTHCDLFVYDAMAHFYIIKICLFTLVSFFISSLKINTKRISSPPHTENYRE